MVFSSFNGAKRCNQTLNRGSHSTPHPPWCTHPTMLLGSHDNSRTIVLCNIFSHTKGILPESLRFFPPLSLSVSLQQSLHLPPASISSILHLHIPRACLRSAESPREVLATTTPSLVETGLPPPKERSLLIFPTHVTPPRGRNQLLSSSMEPFL